MTGLLIPEHMCREEWNLKDTKKVTESVIVANSMETPVVAKGNVTIEADVGGETQILAVSEVLCFPELPMNLLSVHTICSLGHCVVFTKNECKVFNQRGNLVAVGKQQDGLYRLSQRELNNSCLTKPKEDIKLWHRRMGLLNVQSLKQLWSMVTGMQFSDAEILSCVSCLEGKHHRQPFNNKGTRAADALELVHSDLCAPMETKSLGGSGYFLTFIDDYSRKCFIYFIRSTSEVFEYFKDLPAFTET